MSSSSSSTSTSTTSTTSSTTTSTSATTSSSTGAGGGSPCDLDPSASLGDTVLINVWAKDPGVPWIPGSANTGAADFFTGHGGDLPPDTAAYHNHLATFKLYAADDPGNRVLLHQCFSDGHHVTAKPVGKCVCLGYAVQILSASLLKPEDYAALTRIQGETPEKNALIPDEPMSITCDAFGSHAASQPGCSTVDKLYGAK